MFVTLGPVPACNFFRQEVNILLPEPMRNFFSFLSLFNPEFFYAIAQGVAGDA